MEDKIKNFINMKFETEMHMNFEILLLK